MVVHLFILALSSHTYLSRLCVLRVKDPFARNICKRSVLIHHTWGGRWHSRLRTSARIETQLGVVQVGMSVKTSLIRSILRILILCFHLCYIINTKLGWIEGTLAWLVVSLIQMLLRSLNRSRIILVYSVSRANPLLLLVLRLLLLPANLQVLTHQPFHMLRCITISTIR